MIKNIIAKAALRLYELYHSLLAFGQRQQFLANPKSKVHPNFRFGKHNRVTIDSSAIIDIAENVAINEFNFITVKPGAHFTVGTGTYITRATISILEKLEIGENCILGEGLKIFDHNHKHTSDPFSVSKTEFNTGGITIGNNVWTGANVTILKNVKIGNNCIIGTGVLLYQDVPDNSVIKLKQELVVQPL